MSSSYEESINQQYSHPAFETDVDSLFDTTPSPLEGLSREDLGSADQFHIRGHTATRELAHQAGLREGMSILDLGSGLGGPARTLAAERGCHVVGIDLTEAYVRAATALTERVGLDDRVSFLHGTVLDLPFDESQFDAVWLQHVSMNVEDKHTLFSEAYRVLRPGGHLVLHEIGAGARSPLHYPVPWADGPSLSDLTSPRRMRARIEETGFSVEVWIDTSADCLAWFREQFDSDTDQSSEKIPLLLPLVMGENASQKRRNVARNLAENRITVVQGTARCNTQ